MMGEYFRLTDAFHTLSSGSRCATITQYLLIYNRPNSEKKSMKSSPQRLHSTHICIIRVANTLQAIYSLIYDQHTHSWKETCSNAHFGSVCLKSGGDEKKTKKQKETQSVLLVRGRLFIGLLQRGRRLFPHVWDQLFTRLKGGEEEGDSLLTQHWKWHTVFELEAFNPNCYTFHHNLVPLGAKPQPHTETAESSNTW